MANELPTGIKLYDSSENVKRQSFNENFQVINDKLINEESALASHLADYASYKADNEYPLATVADQQIQVTHESDSAVYKFKLAADVNGGVITISDDGGTSDLPLLDIDGNAVTDLEKGFVEVIKDAENFTLRPRGAKALEFLANYTGTELTLLENVPAGYYVYSNEPVVINNYVQTIIDKSTPVTVVGSAYTTSASARPQRLSNGWIVTAVFDSGNTYLRWYVSKDNGINWVLLTYASISSHYWSISSKGTYVYTMSVNTGGTTPQVFFFDATTVGASVSPYYNIDSSQTAFGGGCSLTINPAQTYLHACWSSKNSTYPNSFNIRYCKGTVNTDGSVTWGSVEQRTTLNSTTQAISPCIVVKQDGYPIIFFVTDAGSDTRSICKLAFNGSSWDTGLNFIYGSLSNTYIQASPSADVASDGSIWVVWHGPDSTDTVVNNIRYSKSTDNGVTWATAVKLTSGNTPYLHQQNACVSVDKDNNVYVEWVGRHALSDTYFQLRKLVYTASTTSWGAITNLTSNTTASIGGASLCNNYRNFTDPLCIWKDEQTNQVKFRGVWTNIGNQIIPSIDEATDKSQLQVVIAGALKPYGIDLKQYNGFASKEDLWIKPTFWLYKDGNECLNITGGWLQGAYNYGTFTKNATNLHFVMPNVGNNKRWNVAITGKTIDLTPYSKLKVVASNPVNITSDYPYIIISSPAFQNYDTPNIIASLYIDYCTDKEFEIDVTNINQPVYIHPGIDNWSLQYLELTVTKIWLE